jgi:glycosyltransferase involved in cell wall biosynthesis
MRQVLLALSELGRPVDLLTYPIGTDVEIPGLRIFRSGNPFGYGSVPIGLSLRKIVLDLPITTALRWRMVSERYACVHAVEEAAFPAAVLARRHGIPLLYDMQSSLAEQLARLSPFRTPPARRVLEAAERWLLRRSDVVVMSAGLAARVRSMVPQATVREWHFPSAPAGADPAEVARLRQRLGIAARAPVVLYSGTFEAYQGLPELIAAIPLVRRRSPDATFVFVGAEGTEGSWQRPRRTSPRARSALCPASHATRSRPSSRWRTCWSRPVPMAAIFHSRSSTTSPRAVRSWPPISPPTARCSRRSGRCS